MENTIQPFLEKYCGAFQKGCKNGQITLKFNSSILDYHIITHVKGYFTGTTSVLRNYV